MHHHGQGSAAVQADPSCQFVDYPAQLPQERRFAVLSDAISMSEDTLAVVRGINPLGPASRAQSLPFHSTGLKRIPKIRFKPNDSGSPFPGKWRE